MSEIDQSSDEGTNGGSKTPGAPGAVVVAEDPAAPSKDVSSKRQSLSDLFTIVSVSHCQSASRAPCWMTETVEC